VERKAVVVDCRQLYFRFFVILPPEIETAKISTNAGITPKSNENSELKKKKATKRRNWIEVNRKWPSYPAVNRKYNLHTTSAISG